ncbi:hypothetical protein ACNF49_40185 [Actinomadura sp. ATCC 39365]|uniref:hypothetical protein n=1 Tax=Nonomuraea sp. NPDC005692 TaxID=3157168 RepID=UPI0033CE63EE
MNAGLVTGPSERGPRIGFSPINTRFAACRDALGLDRALDLPVAEFLLQSRVIELGSDGEMSRSLRSGQRC